MCDFFRFESVEESEIFNLLNTDDFSLYDTAPLLYWNDKPMVEWNTDDVLNFISNELSLLYPTEDEQRIYFQHFQSISGYIFSNLNEEECQLAARSMPIGSAIYRAKEWHLRNEQNAVMNHDNSCNSNYDNNQQLIHTDAGSSIIDNNPKRPGRPRSSKSAINNKMGKRSQKLWEFLLHLLQDDNTCPNLIKWDNFEEGTFKFVQSDKVARLWGSRKKNENMTYEKFSRAMRYYYKSQVLLPVPGRRLVYKFGPQAKGWRAISPSHSSSIVKQEL